MTIPSRPNSEVRDQSSEVRVAGGELETKNHRARRTRNSKVKGQDAKVKMLRGRQST